MKVQAEISLYPLRQNELAKPIQRFIELLESSKLTEVRRLKDFLAIFKKIMFIANQSGAI